MSASEKLKELANEPMGQRGYVLADLFPQIVAVVEAAENVIANNAYPDKLASALAALDEALS